MFLHLIGSAFHFLARISEFLLCIVRQCRCFSLGLVKNHTGFLTHLFRLLAQDVSCLFSGVGRLGNQMLDLTNSVLRFAFGMLPAIIVPPASAPTTGTTRTFRTIILTRLSVLRLGVLRLNLTRLPVTRLAVTRLRITRLNFAARLFYVLTIIFIVAAKIGEGDAATAFNVTIGVVLIFTTLSYILIFPTIIKLRKSHPHAPRPGPRRSGACHFSNAR